MSVADAFGRAGAYEAHAGVQAQVAATLAQRIGALGLAPVGQGLEIGCGTGLLSAHLVDRFDGWDWTITDIAPAMLARAGAKLGPRPRLRLQVMDGERPAPGRAFDLVASSLAFQWFADLPAAVAGWRARLAPGGWLAFTTLVEGSFAQWRAAHEGLPCGLHDYPAPADLAALGLAVSVESIALPCQGARAFLRHLKGIGAGVPRAGHQPLGPAQLRAVMARFEAGGALASYEVATCLVQAPPR